jgi:hypothetical protein
VRAACGPAPQQVVRGHAEGLEGVDGARAYFAVRYLLREGQGLNVPHGVAVGRALVRGGAFETCVCIPHGGNLYPQLAAVVFSPGSTGETSQDAARAMFSQRYATLGDEDASRVLAMTPSPAQREAAVAALSDRTHRLAVRGLDGAMEGGQVYAGLVSDERLVAAQVLGARVTRGALAYEWIMPGRAHPTEGIALVQDRNNNRRCDAGDRGALAPAAGLAELDGATLSWVEGRALDAVCRALSIEGEREAF